MSFLFVVLALKGREWCVNLECLAVPTCQGSSPSSIIAFLHFLKFLLLIACLELESDSDGVFLPWIVVVGGTLLHKVLTGSPLVGDPLRCLISELSKFF